MKKSYGVVERSRVDASWHSQSHFDECFGHSISYWLKASPADRQAVSFQVATAVVKTKDSKVPCELWNPEFDGKLRNGIGKSLTEQNSVIEEILVAEPRLSRGAVVTRFVRKLLNHASKSNLEVRQSAIRQIVQLQPELDEATVGAHLDQLARAGLPIWVNSSFWSREIDPLLLIGVRSAQEEFESVLSRINLLYPSASAWEIRERHTRYRSKKGGAEFAPEDEWPIEADQMLREAVIAEIKIERQAILRVSRQHKELRVGAIQQRMRMLQRRFTTDQQHGRFAWSEEIDQLLLEANKNNSLALAVATIATQHGRSREMVYRHCERLGIPRQQRRPIRRWEAADLRYLMSHVNHQAPQNIAEALGRSCSSVVRKIQQLGLSTAVSKYSLRDLRRDLPVRHSTIVRWIAEGKLKVALKKRKLKRGHQQRIREEDLVEFLAKYHQELNGRKL